MGVNLFLRGLAVCLAFAQPVSAGVPPASRRVPGRVVLGQGVRSGPAIRPGVGPAGIGLGPIPRILPLAVVSAPETQANTAVSALEGDASERGAFPSALVQLGRAAAGWNRAGVLSSADAVAADETIPPASHYFGRMFSLVRRLLTRPAVRQFLREAFADHLEISQEQQERYGLPSKVKEVSESQLMHLLSRNRQLWPEIETFLSEIESSDGGKSYEGLAGQWNERFKELLREGDIAARFQALNDPAEPMRLERADGKPGYVRQRLYVNHARLVGGRRTRPDDLKQVVIDFIRGAKKELMFNVFDFDLMDVADELIAAAARGVGVTGGIDKRNIESRPAVQAVFERLSAQKGVTMVAVDSVGLNHQKLLVRDWNDDAEASSLLSSGNLTQSCIGPEGDLVDLPLAGRRGKTAESVPNANHMVALDGGLVAQVVANKLLQTLEYGLRGREYPLGGAFKIFGPKPKGSAEAPYVVLSFAPKGTLGDVSRDMIRRVILETRGALRVMVFAFSSKTILQALIDRAKLEVAEGRTFDFQAFGDTPFTMRDYSVLLALAGLAVADQDGVKRYVESQSNELRGILGSAAYERLLDDLRVAPRAYGEHSDGEGHKFNAKIHHKVVISGDFAILASSFNPSDNAEHNNEQIMATNDPVLVLGISQAYDGLFTQSRRTIRGEAERRNARGEVSSDDVGSLYSRDDEQVSGR